MPAPPVQPADTRKYSELDPPAERRWSFTPLGDGGPPKARLARLSSCLDRVDLGGYGSPQCSCGTTALVRSPLIISSGDWMPGVSQYLKTASMSRSLMSKGISLASKGSNLSKRLHELNRHEHCRVGKMRSLLRRGNTTKSR
jgi:hypothetical protein